MDGKHTPFEEWLDSTKHTEYKEVFISNGFDDLDLLREMDDGEIASMIQTLEMKRGANYEVKEVSGCFESSCKEERV